MSKWVTLVRLGDGTEVQIWLPAAPKTMVIETTGTEVAK
jgi:hypothetical protein